MQCSESTKATFTVVTLGCAKNTVETEFIEGSMQEVGYRRTSIDEADVIIVNTCGFIKSAKEESIETILELASCKEDGSCRALIVTGCLAQRYPDELFEEIPEVDGIIGISELKDLASYVSEILGGKRIRQTGIMPVYYEEKRIRNIWPGPSAYMQISDGCDNSCTYCAIPIMRGRYRSRSLDSLLSEAKGLLAHGVKEIVLIGQDTSCYGKDIYGKAMTEVLIEGLASLEELEWIRILYCQPQNFSDALIEAFATNDKICPYIDVPFQHASNKILTKMGRRGHCEDYLKLIQRIRDQMPDVALRTSFIVGFPGENDRDFSELMQFVEEIEFDYTGLFEYSPEDNTAAQALPNHVPRELVRERYRMVSDLRDTLALHRGRSYLGRRIQVLVEDMVEEQGALGSLYYQGRAIFQAPEIDGEIRIKSPGKKLCTGDIVEVIIKNGDIYDFEGELEC